MQHKIKQIMIPHMNSGSMSVIPPHMFYHRNFDIDSREVKFMKKEELDAGNIQDDNVYQRW